MSPSGSRRPSGDPSHRPASPSRRRQPRRLHPLVIAGLVIGIAAFVTFYAFNEGLPFIHRFTVYAVVNNSVNVRAGDPVRISGIDVGSVSGTSPDGNATRIAFTLDSSGQPIHTDATVTIRDRLFLEGSYYLQLDPGSPSAPIVRDGATIPMSHTASPVQFYKILSTFDLATRTNLAGLVATFDKGFDAQPGQPAANSGAGGLKSAIPQLAPAFADVAITTRALQGTQPGDVERLLGASSDVAGTLAENTQALTGLVDGLNSTAGALASTDGALAQSISGLDATLRAAPPDLSAIDAALAPLGRLAGALTPSLAVAPPLVSSLTSTVRALAAVVAPAERARLLETLRATFAQFPTILTDLARTFPVTRQVTDCLRTHIVPLFKEQVPDGSLSSGHPVWQDFAHFLPDLAGATGNFDANGPYTRVLASAGTNTLAGNGLGTIPGLGQLVGTGPPGGSSLTGATPTWVGDLPASAFRPDISCTTQPLPSLAASAGAVDLQSRTSSPSVPLTRQAFDADLARARRGR